VPRKQNRRRDAKAWYATSSRPRQPASGLTSGERTEGALAVLRRGSEVPALPHFPYRRDNCRLLAYDSIFQYRERRTHSNSRMTIIGTYTG